jgi:hypothetical protein
MWVVVMEDFVTRKAFEVANFEPENGFQVVLNRKAIESIKGRNGRKLEEVVFRKPYSGIKIEADKIQLANRNPIPNDRPNQKAMFDRGDIVILNREFRENANISPGTRLKMFLRFKTGKK